MPWNDNFSAPRILKRWLSHSIIDVPGPQVALRTAVARPAAAHLSFTMKPAAFHALFGISILAIAPSTGFRLQAANWQAVDRFIGAHCLDCHTGENAANGLDLKSLGRDLMRPDNLAKWVRTYDRVERGEMPPQDAGVLPAAARAEFLKTIAGELTTASQTQAEVVLRRLNRFEYENTLRDLFGIRTELQSLLPEDGKAHGFDNVGEALDMSSVQLQRYLEATGKALDDAVRRGPQPERVAKSHRFDQGRNGDNVGKHWHRTDDGAVVFFNDGGFPAISLDSFRAPHEGPYRFRLDAFAYQTVRPVTFAVYTGQFGRNADSRLVGNYQAKPAGAAPIEIETYLYRGDSLRLMPRGLGGNYAEIKRDGPGGYQGPGLAVSNVEVDGPILSDWPGRGHRLLFSDLPIVDQGPASERSRKFYRPTYEVVSSQPEADAARLLERFATAAFRRPVSATKLAPYLTLAKTELNDGAGFEDAMRTAYVAMLCSPDFIFLRAPRGKLDDYALASRLSYFLWSSLPDDELLAVAARGELSKPDVLRAQTERLLLDARAMRFTENFVGQWLNLRDIDFTIPDKQLYPEFDSLLLDAMVRETELFFGEIVANNRPVHDFIDSDWTMLNERLAEHYRIDGVDGPEFRKVALRPEHHRGGILTQASVLKVSANGTTTSPVTRGGYVLERLLNQSSSPPPPGVPGVEPDIRGATTLREQLDKHRAIETCNNCHKIIDPPGFALENYDVMGGWRENYRVLNKDLPAPPTALTGGKRVTWRVGPKVDASGATTDGASFRNLVDYKQLLLKDENLFARALAEKLLVYATGRGLGFSDRPEVERVVAPVAAEGYGFRDLVHAVVQSEIFLHK